jgi:lysophospholipase L1-like esterase
MLARIGTDVLAYAPDVVLMLGGTNNIGTGMTNAQISNNMLNLESMVRLMLKAGILPIIVTPPARNSAPIETRKIQPFYYALAQAYGLPLLDLFRLTVDPVTGNYLTGYSADGTHLLPAAIAACRQSLGRRSPTWRHRFAPPTQPPIQSPRLETSRTSNPPSPARTERADS